VKKVKRNPKKGKKSADKRPTFRKKKRRERHGRARSRCQVCREGTDDLKGKTQMESGALVVFCEKGGAGVPKIRSAGGRKKRNMGRGDPSPRQGPIRSRGMKKNERPRKGNRSKDSVIRWAAKGSHAERRDVQLKRRGTA